MTIGGEEVADDDDHDDSNATAAAAAMMEQQANEAAVAAAEQQLLSQVTLTKFDFTVVTRHFASTVTATVIWVLIQICSTYGFHGQGTRKLFSSPSGWRDIGVLFVENRHLEMLLL